MPANVLQEIRSLPVADERAITEVSFSSAKEEFAFLERFKDWKVPGFAVITGRNAAGKSQVLKYIQQVTRSSSSSEVFYMDSNHYFQQMGGSGSSYGNDYLKTLDQEDAESKRYRFSRIDYDERDLSLEQPMRLLCSLHSQYLQRVLAIKLQTSNSMDILNVYRWYRIEELHKNPKDLLADIVKEKEFPEFILNIQSLEFLGHLLYRYSRSFAKDPIMEVNSILKKYHFQYSIVPNPQNDRELSFKRESDGRVIEYNRLSSGEQMLVSILTWQYRIGGLTIEPQSPYKIDNKVKLMLLDEPDKHLDPKLCRLLYKILHDEFHENQRIQVIMVTHRIDTVALAPHDSVFLIEKNVNTQAHEILQCHKMQAMFRMSSNLRKITDFHVRVYTESTNDALFYEGVYNSLKEFCRARREEESSRPDPDYYWYFRNEVPRRLLSERYQLSFYTCATEKATDGGCTEVVKVVQRFSNKHFLEKSHIFLRNGMFEEPGLYKPYGILDNDYGKDYQLMEKGLEKQVEVLKRHSLENFIFDPFILSTLLTDDEIEAFVDGSNLIDRKLLKSEQAMAKVNVIDDAIKNGIFHNVEENLNSYFVNLLIEITPFIDAIKAIRDAITRRKFQYIQEHLETYFRILLVTIENYNRGPKQREQGKRFYANIRSKLEANTQLCDIEISMLIQDGTILIIKYPSEFLNLRGHDIHDHFSGAKNAFEITGHIVEKITQHALKCMPMDLADIFFNLNKKIRLNIRGIIKPGKAELGPKLQLDEESKDDGEEHKDAGREGVGIVLSGSAEDSIEDTTKLLKQATGKELSRIPNALESFMAAKLSGLTDAEQKFISSIIREGRIHRGYDLAIACSDEELANAYFLVKGEALVVTPSPGARNAQDAVAMKLNNMEYDNYLLNAWKGRALLNYASQQYDVSTISLLLELGKDQIAVDALLEAVKEQSSGPVLDLLIGKEKKSTSYTHFDIVSTATRDVDHRDSFMNFISNLADKLDLGLLCKRFLYHNDLKRFGNIIDTYGINVPSSLRTIDILRDDREFKRKVLLKVSPDKNPNAKEQSHKDTIFVHELREKLTTRLDFKKLLDEKLRRLNAVLHKTNIGFKSLDAAVDVARLVYEPTLQHAKKVALDAIYLYGMYAGVNGYSIIVGGGEILYQLYLGEYQAAFDIATTTVGTMALPHILAQIGMPYLSFAYGIWMAYHIGYNTLENARSFISERMDADADIRSIKAYRDAAKALSSQLQHIYDFDTVVKEYEAQLHDILLEMALMKEIQLRAEKNEIDEASFNYIYDQIIEGQNSPLNGVIEAEELVL